MQRTPRRDTPCELTLRSELHRLGLRFRVDWPVPGTRRRADVAFRGAKVAVFVDGCFWHGCPAHMTWPRANAEWWREKIRRNSERDRDTDEHLATQGWVSLRFWEHEPAAAAARRVARRLARRRAGRTKARATR